MAALVVSDAAIALNPLLVAPVEDRGRLMSIYSELKGWQCRTNERELGPPSCKYEDFGDILRSERDAISNYYNIAQKTSEVVLAKLGYCGPESLAKFKDYKIIAAYDPKGNLQGVAAVKIIGKKGVAAKVDYLVTAFWNMPFNEPKNPARTRGSGTCLIERLIEILPTDGAIFLEPTAAAVEFYSKRFFQVIKNWTPKTDGAVCGMALYQKDFAKLREKTEGQITSCDESRLPPTIKHYLDYLPRGRRGEKGLRELAQESKV